ncbi:hypothetical protein BU14_0273s0006, partial [Porphyra umbilicalis]
CHDAAPLPPRPNPPAPAPPRSPRPPCPPPIAPQPPVASRCSLRPPPTGWRSVRATAAGGGGGRTGCSPPLECSDGVAAAASGGSRADGRPPLGALCLARPPPRWCSPPHCGRGCPPPIPPKSPSTPSPNYPPSAAAGCGGGLRRLAAATSGAAHTYTPHNPPPPQWRCLPPPPTRRPPSLPPPPLPASPLPRRWSARRTWFAASPPPPNSAAAPHSHCRSPPPPASPTAAGPLPPPLLSPTAATSPNRRCFPHPPLLPRREAHMPRGAWQPVQNGRAGRGSECGPDFTVFSMCEPTHVYPVAIPSAPRNNLSVARLTSHIEGVSALGLLCERLFWGRCAYERPMCAVKAPTGAHSTLSALGSLPSSTAIQGDLTSSALSEAADGASEEGGVPAVGIRGHLGGG